MTEPDQAPTQLTPTPAITEQTPTRPMESVAPTEQWRSGHRPGGDHSDLTAELPR